MTLCPCRPGSLRAVPLIVATGLLCGGGAFARSTADGDWPTYHGDLGARQYAALEQITRDNVGELRVAWTWESPDNAMVEENRRLMSLGWKSTPLEVDGRLFVNTSLGQVAAIDALSGETLWVYDTRAYEAGRPTNLGFNSRGVAYWRGTVDGPNGSAVQERLFQPSNDSMLWAIDAATGKPIESFGEEGRVDLIATLRRETNRRNYTIMSAPLVVGDVVIVGSSIFDGPTRQEMPPGDVRAFDVRTGELVWTFHNPPRKGEIGHGTWLQGSAEYTGNANVWTNLSADPELGLVYLPFGTPTNDWYGGHRPGDNLFAESIVCVDAATGEYVWHFQIVHHGLWDYDLPMAPTLFDAVIDGAERKGVAMPTKQGFVFVFDRVTGEPIWPIEERPVPPSDVPGERWSPTQPFPTKPPPFEHQGMSDETIVDFTPEIRAEAMEILSHYRYGPLYTPPVVSTEEVWGTIQLPGWAGGANWWGASADPETGRLYVPSFTSPIVVALQEPDPARSNFRYIRGMAQQAGLSQAHSANLSSVAGPRGLPIVKPPYGRVTAYDLGTGDIAWQRPHGEGIRQEIIDAGAPDPGPVGSPSGTGPLLTKELLFLGKGARTSRVGGGGEEAALVAYDKSTGDIVAEIPLDTPPLGTPMGYEAGGKQFIVFAVGGAGPEKAALVALSLP